ncbi:hemolysin III family protein [Clostridium sediminicola]|uniref:PAQR family membrane homeostasis protein TrhA n=1 Tax=Clostridium sediminicola TaxID=3114879 RepID=UPI0031F1F511
MRNIIREPINSITHLFGIVLSAIGLVFLLISSINSGDSIKIISSIVFSFGLIGLYSASTIYHWYIASEKTIEILRKVDHSMIYILIAATYTPICLITLKGLTGYILLTVVWSLGIIGIVLKLLWLNAPRWLYTSFYLILGWAAIFVIYPLYKILPTAGLMLLFAGGISYSVGAVFYATKSERIKIWKFGFHEIFHIFILIGSLTHYLMIYKYVI